MTAAEWLAVATAIAALAGPIVTFGVIKQKVVELDAKIGNLATKESVTALDGRVGALETEMQEVPKLVTSVEVMKAEMKGFRDLVTRDTDELKHGNRNIKQAVDSMGKMIAELRGQHPAP